jgi:hypothetical protein
MELNEIMLAVVGFAASLLTQILKLLSDRFGLALPGWAKIVVFAVVSGGLAFFFFKDALLADPLGSIASIVGVAVVIYEILNRDVVFPLVRLA